MGEILLNRIRNKEVSVVAAGCDIENVNRFKKVLKNKRFLSNVFTDNEIRYCFNKKKPEVYLARKFAGKEAVFKALSSLGEDVPLGLIEVLDKDKKNVVQISYNVIKHRYRILVDVSNTKDTVLASAVAQRLAG